MSERLPLRVVPVDKSLLARWSAFLETSNNATLFHDPDFLAYHPDGLHAFHHLFFMRGDDLVAVLPGGTRENRYVSPLGASWGGFAVGKKLLLAEGLELVEHLQTHALANGWSGIDVTLSPLVHWRQPTELVPFALMSRGFSLTYRQMSFVITLEREAGYFERRFRSKQRGCVRAALRKGATATFGGLELFDAFLPVFRDTYERLGATPTHSERELRWLLETLPDRVKILSVQLDGVPIAGLFIFLTSERTAYSFYICSSTAHRDEHGAVVAFAALTDELGARGYAYLDLGPSASTTAINEGVVAFKESLGASAYARDRWAWDRPGT